MGNNEELNFHSEEIDFYLSDQSKQTSWIKEAIQKEGKICGEINYIFCSDSYLLKLNQTYLDHDTFTDIITFNYNQEEVVSGDIFISIERVEENASNLKVNFVDELHRVMIHGILHLIGYEDKGSENQVTMRAKEDFYLTLHPSN